MDRTDRTDVAEPIAPRGGSQRPPERAEAVDARSSARRAFDALWWLARFLTALFLLDRKSVV